MCQQHQRTWNHGKLLYWLKKQKDNIILNLLNVNIYRFFMDSKHISVCFLLFLIKDALLFHWIRSSDWLISVFRFIGCFCLNGWGFILWAGLTCCCPKQMHQIPKPAGHLKTRQEVNKVSSWQTDQSCWKNTEQPITSLGVLLPSRLEMAWNVFWLAPSCWHVFKMTRSASLKNKQTVRPSIGAS